MTLFFSQILNLFYDMITSIFANSLTGLFLMFIVLQVIIWCIRRLLFP